MNPTDEEIARLAGAINRFWERKDLLMARREEQREAKRLLAEKRKTSAALYGGKPKRHKWRRDEHWKVCVDCGCRYRTGMIDRVYEQPDGRTTVKAEACIPLEDSSGGT